MGFVEAVKTCYGPKYARFSPTLDRLLPDAFGIAISLAMLLLCVVTIFKRTKGPNRFGPDPLSECTDETIIA
ncbi:hypothetical protein [Roseovarius sp.]|uniref:hypothetical protein n=1 Tax=Roseovarius sp. TaxID=1486281 RepID=UPI000C61C6EA|nr:hypothetical protein [Roseovarius sp.]MAO27236.1 hypothetical protein [Roseovarius sp.]MAZ19755.1 hypothetical protein [Roseovarius sp.]|tara:strand:- start:280 stop:495 length:216 start_codon:yes stop_codon:yes gene_type:complete